METPDLDLERSEMSLDVEPVLINVGPLAPPSGTSTSSRKASRFRPARPSRSQGGNREVGFYLVCDGSGMPHRGRIRPPCFLMTGGLERLITGARVPDVVPPFGSLNLIGGECAC